MEKIGADRRLGEPGKDRDARRDFAADTRDVGELESSPRSQDRVRRIGRRETPIENPGPGSIPARRKSAWSRSASRMGVVSGDATTSTFVYAESRRRMSGVTTRPGPFAAFLITSR